MYNPIEFPGLRLGPFDPGPTAFHIAGWPIQWYGMIMAFGFLLAAAYGVWRAPKAGIKGDDISDALLFCVPAGIIGARLYYVIFNWQMFSNDPLKVFRVWEGGMAFYGSLIGALAVALIFARARKLPALALLDLGVVGFLIGQCVGRWGNYVNREAYGVETTLPWRMRLFAPEAMARVDVHPTFLYESLWTGIGFVILHILLTRRKYDGQLLLCYMAWYGLGRGMIEGLRTDSLYIFNTGLRVSQVLGFASAAVGLALLIWFKLKPPAARLYADTLDEPEVESEGGVETGEDGDDV